MVTKTTPVKSALFALFLFSFGGARSAPLTVVAGVDPLHWPRTLAGEIASRQQQRSDPAAIFYMDATTNVSRVEWAPYFVGATSIHFIGIGPGAATLAALASQFPEMTIDQFTTIADGEAISQTALTVPGNVLFADNYGATTWAGAFNLQPDLALYLGQDSPIAAWYFGTIYDKHSLTGYAFADCPHGTRPLEGFRARRVGQPVISVVADAKAHTIEQFFSGGASGRYFLDASTDLQTWTLGIGVFVLDGRPARGVAVAIEGFPTGAQLFFRLRSVEASF